MKRLVIVGTGARARGGYAKRLLDRCAESVEIVGLCDPNVLRCEFFKNSLGLDAAVYEDFDLNPGGLLKVFDVGCVDRKSKVFVKYRAGFSSGDIEDLKELTANRVTHAVTNTYGVSSEAAGGVSVSYSSAWTGSGSTSLSDDTREILNNYKVRGMY